MFTRPWFSLLRRQVLIHRRGLAFLLTVAAVLLAWQAFAARPPAVVPVAASPVPTSSVPITPAGWVRLPVRLADGDMAVLLHAGDRIDLWATDPRASKSVRVARGAEVIAVPEPEGGAAMSTQKSRLVLMNIRVTEVNKVSTSGVDGFLTYTFGH